MSTITQRLKFNVTINSNSVFFDNVSNIVLSGGEYRAYTLSFTNGVTGLVWDDAYAGTKNPDLVYIMIIPDKDMTFSWGYGTTTNSSLVVKANEFIVLPLGTTNSVAFSDATDMEAGISATSARITEIYGYNNSGSTAKVMVFVGQEDV